MKIFQVLTQSRIKLESSGFLPESEFPQEESLRDGNNYNCELCQFHITANDDVAFYNSFVKHDRKYCIYGGSCTLFT